MMKKQGKLVICVLAVLLAAVLALAAWAALGSFSEENSPPEPDENGMYQLDGQWLEAMPELDEDSVTSFAGRLNAYVQGSLGGAGSVYYAAIPDKSWYLAEEGALTLDHGRLEELLASSLTEAEGISLTGALEPGDYYLTDRHWRQERLQNVLDTLGKAMDFSVKLDSFTAESYTPFRGNYAQHLNSPPEESFSYLTGGLLDKIRADSYQYPDLTGIYDRTKLESDNTYDFFLGGVSPLVTLESPGAAGDRELVIFGDSYASCLAPLLCAEYKTVTIVDLRFIFSTLLPDMVDFEGKDILFLYSDWVLNNSAMLRF